MCLERRANNSKILLISSVHFDCTMKKGKGKEKEKEGDEEASTEKRESEPIRYVGGHWTTKYPPRLSIDKTKRQGDEGSSEEAEWGLKTMSEDQVALARTLCRDRLSYKEIGKIMGVPGGVVDSVELMHVVADEETAMEQDPNWQGQ